ncbi:MAG: dienelactone hydrolase family protein [Clostridia bacterium]|nr:dienelactone hydrolase family protein [Clostridia bacterium]
MKSILSAISLWKKFNLKNPLGASEWGIEEVDGVRRSHVSYSGHKAEDGNVRIYARFYRPEGDGKKPVVLFLGDAGQAVDEEVLAYFAEKGYAVLVPDYSGKLENDDERVFHTFYPPSLSHGNFEKAQGLSSMRDLDADQTTWFEWTYVALYSIEYLKSRADVGNIGIVGVRTGGEIAWQAMLSPDVKCGVPINAAGWRSFSHIAKFGDNIAHNLSDDRHRYIAAVEAQSYAPYVKCPVLMLCALHDKDFDCDRAYDTYSRIGNSDGNALAYSSESGGCIGPRGLADMDLFLEKNLKGRQIYIPETLNVNMKEMEGGLEVTVECDPEGILEEAGVYYAEAEVKVKSPYREWRCMYKTDGRTVKNGKFTCTLEPYAGATAVFVFAYAKYINGFRVMSKITSRRLSKTDPNAIRSRKIFTGKSLDCFSIAQHKEYSIGDIFLEREAVPKFYCGYGDIKGAYSPGGIRTYKISSPRYLPPDNALLQFNVYSPETQDIRVSVEVANVEKEEQRYSCFVPVKGGGKWKRIILKAADFKGGEYGYPLETFGEGNALVFECAGEEKAFSIVNILWL